VQRTASLVLEVSTAVVVYTGKKMVNIELFARKYFYDIVWAANDDGFVRNLSFILLAEAAIIACGELMRVKVAKAVYGRYSDSGAKKWSMSAAKSWFIQEIPSLLVPLSLIVWTDAPALNVTNWLLLGLFMFHYTHRSLLYPFLIRGGKPSHIQVVFSSFAFCMFNGFLQGYFLTSHQPYTKDWLAQPNFILGVVIYCVGAFINLQSHHILRSLRKPGESGYKIPKGGMFEYVSAANYFGEVVEWGGYALASWSLPALAFFLHSVCFLGSRSIHHHKFYQDKFKGEYPRRRKAFIPYLL